MARDVLSHGFVIFSAVLALSCSHKKDIVITYPAPILGTFPPRQETPSWSGSGTIAYRDNGIVLVNHDGSYLVDTSLVGIWLIDPVSKTRRRLTHFGYNPSWSPDSRKIAFEDGGSVFLVDADSGQVQTLTRSGSFSFPRWSPDGKSIVADYLVSGLRFDLSSIDAASGVGHRICPNDTVSSRRMASWEPSAKGLVLVGSVEGTHSIDLYFLDTLSCQQSRLTTAFFRERFPQYSPDGSNILFTEASASGGSAIWVMDAGGGNSRLVASNGAAGTWSPDGSEIVFQEAGYELNSSQGTLQLLDLRTGRQTQLTTQWTIANSAFHSSNVALSQGGDNGDKALPGAAQPFAILDGASNQHPATSFRRPVWR